MKLLSLFFLILWYGCQTDRPKIMTVTGPIHPGEMGLTLEHEHVTTDFIGAEKTKQPQYPVDTALAKLLPFFVELKASGVQTLVECTPAHIGRDVLLLREISQKTGLNILTNTGYYAAVQKKYLPAHAYSETARELAKRWISEWETGIDGTGVKPGFIKLGVGKSQLDTMEQKIVRAGALTHLETGLKIAIHTGSGLAANDEVDILAGEGVAPGALIVVHAQNCSSEDQISLAQRGCWISLDGIGAKPDKIERYLGFLLALKEASLLHRVLISHDNGWAVIKNEDGCIGFEMFGADGAKPYAAIFDSLVPALMNAGFTREEIDLILVQNPSAAFTIEKLTL
ncbi:MAG: phosphotriesterase [Cyclobacteriaceae bacterium]|nr:phosphotriesterase [Cyclobacteriaceae bacterium]